MNRQEGESFVGYIKRVIAAVEDKTIDYEEFGDALLGEQNVYSRDNLRKALYVLRKLIPFLEEDGFEVDYSNDEELQIMKDDIYKERVKLRDQRRELNKLLTMDARYENLVEFMAEKLQYLPKLEITPIKSSGSNVEAALLLSDIHYGIEIDNVINYYSTDIAKERLAILCEKTIKYCQLHKVDTLHLNLGGDLVSGIIQLQCRIDAEESIIDQTVNIAEILSQFIQNLMNNIPTVKVYGVIGNHGRVNEDKKKNLAVENFEKLVFKFIQVRLPGVTVVTNGKEDWLTYKIKNKNIFLTHGDKDSLSNAKKHAIDVSQQIPDEIFLGHVHHVSTKDDNGTKIITNGSVVGVDDFSMTIRANTKPYQILRIYDTDTMMYEIDL